MNNQWTSQATKRESPVAVRSKERLTRQDIDPFDANDTSTAIVRHGMAERLY